MVVVQQVFLEFPCLELLTKWFLKDYSATFYNHGHNIMRIFDVLPNFPFTASDTKPDY